MDLKVVLAAVKQGGPRLDDELSGILAMGGPLHYCDPELKRDMEIVEAAVDTMRSRSKEMLSEEARTKIESTCLAEKRVGVVSVQSMHEEIARHWVATVNAMNSQGEASCMMIR